MTAEKEGGCIEIDPPPCLTTSSGTAPAIIDMLGFDPRELSMLGFELDDDEGHEPA